jgi:SAM-dependent methyltransferase
MAEATGAFLDRAGLRPGWACLDAGCGDGQVTIHLAWVAGPGGRALGIDVDDDALEIARRAAEAAGVAASFARADVADSPERGAFDIAYARLLVSPPDRPGGGDPRHARCDAAGRRGARDPDTVVHQAVMHQVHAVRP